MEDVTIFSARRSYEYRLDDIRLTLLSNRGVIQHVREAFAFEVAGAGSPMPMFGPVLNTMPPGLVFDYGLAPFPEGHATPIRNIHFEPTRVVIDVAGPSSIIDQVFAMLTDLLTGVRASDGTPAVGTPTHSLDYSEIRLRLPFQPEVLLPNDVYAAVVGALGSPLEQAGTTAVPVLQVRLTNPSGKYQGGSTPAYQTFVLDLRTGTDPGERIYFSGAPLDSDSHLELLAGLEASVAARGLSVRNATDFS